MSRINVELVALTDPRIKLLAKLIGIRPLHAIGEMLPFWFHCTEHGTTEIDEKFIDLIADRDGFLEILISSGMGKKNKNGSIYITGTRGRVEWLTNLRNNGKKGGRPKLLETETNKPDVNHLVFDLETRREPPGFEKDNPLTPALALTKKKKEKKEKITLSHCVELSCNEQQNGDEKMNTGQEMTRIANKWDAIPGVRKSGIVSDFKLQTLLQNAIESGVDLDEICEAQAKFGEKGTTLNGLLNPNADFALKKLLAQSKDAVQVRKRNPL